MTIVLTQDKSGWFQQGVEVGEKHFLENNKGAITQLIVDSWNTGRLIGEPTALHPERVAGLYDRFVAGLSEGDK